jgi:hypothetical protein
MESRLNIWVEDQTQIHMPLSQLMIMEEARSIFNPFKEGECKGSAMDTFTISGG